MEFVTARNDSFQYNAIYAKELKKNDKYKKYYATEGGPRLIYGEIGGTSQTYLSWRPKKAMPNSGSEKTPVEISEILISIVTEKKDTFIYEYEGKYGYSLDEKTLYTLLKKTEKNKYDDPCKTKYKLKEIDFSESNVSNLYSLLFKFNFEEKSDVPELVDMVVELKNCEGTAQYIKIALKYDAKSETYIGSQTIAQIQNCRWEIKSGLISAYNSCKEKTVWSFDTSKVKERGGRTIILDIRIRADE
ncbi:hypothetical protein DAPPUDRAFT_125616 [Daphnia pulex]|uniref:Uncharacterized protein n=1 Tax=Daphnia pulex TaxID=6669 RepID=E9I7F9_DAPPU|nr:hypothetical protein DAPPUDRAFT_125616 [Daphnia pulex]|eukprot:EFX60071.1 hypothetical protein DAPPUDRAFT_125616 [Daphnia pulex]